MLQTVLTWIVAGTITTGTSYAAYTSTAGGTTNHQNPSYEEYDCPPLNTGSQQSHRAGSCQSTRSQGSGSHSSHPVRSRTYDNNQNKNKNNQNNNNQH